MLLGVVAACWACVCNSVVCRDDVTSPCNVHLHLQLPPRERGWCATRAWELGS